MVTIHWADWPAPLLLSINILSVVDLQYEHEEGFVFNDVNHAKVSDPQAIEVLLAFQLLDSVRSGIEFECQ